MVSLDYRTRTEADIRDVDVAAFFGEELPALIADRSELAIEGARELRVEPFTVATSSGTWTLALEAAGLTVRSDADGAAMVELSDADVADVVNDLKTPMTFLTAGTLRMVRGNLGDFLDWWVVLRSLIDMRPAHARGAVTFENGDGSPLDLRRGFTPADDDEEIAAFLGTAGFLHLRGWFEPKMMDEISADMDRALPTYRRDDGRSWWAQTARGDDRCVRMASFHEHSERVRELLASDRFLRIGRLLQGGY
jgi:hypothetical protein